MCATYIATVKRVVLIGVNALYKSPVVVAVVAVVVVVVVVVVIVVVHTESSGHFPAYPNSSRQSVVSQPVIARTSSSFLSCNREKTDS